MIITTEQYQQVCAGAIKDYPLEAVWLLTNKAGLVKVDNIADNPLENFAVSKANIVWAMSAAGGIKGVVHSHPDGPSYPSHSDMVSQISNNVPYGIVTSSYDSAGDYVEFGVTVENRAPLFNRPFRHGITDCWGFIRDYYEMEFGIKLMDFARGWDWWNHGHDLYTKNLPVAGFEQVSAGDLKTGDVLAFAIRSDVPNHAGVYVGDEVMAHHIAASEAYSESRLPKRSPVHMYMKYLAGVYRHGEKNDQ